MTNFICIIKHIHTQKSPLLSPFNLIVRQNIYDKDEKRRLCIQENGEKNAKKNIVKVKLFIQSIVSEESIKYQWK
jgi:hypothetical protein